MNTVYNFFPAYPGVALRRGSRGGNVRYIQLALEAIRQRMYPQLSSIAADGIFGAATEKAVREYQAIKTLAADGVVGRRTWDAINMDLSALWVNDPAYPGRVLRQGDTGGSVLIMQLMLGNIASLYTSVQSIAKDGAYGSATAGAVRQFQRQFGLAADGVIGRLTWNKILEVSAGVSSRSPVRVTTAYPGSVVRKGARGDEVRIIQSYLNAIGAAIGSVPITGVDGIFGSETENQVKAFQRLAGLSVDGLVGPVTWGYMVAAYNRALSA